MFFHQNKRQACFKKRKSKLDWKKGKLYQISKQKFQGKKGLSKPSEEKSFQNHSTVVKSFQNRSTINKSFQNHSESEKLFRTTLR